MGNCFVEEVDVIEFVGGGNWDGVRVRWEDTRCEKEEDWEREEERESEDKWG